ncbi:hypothetical protein CLIB1444_01S18690 [[Candida] jaroonii]|uniref:Uncharacterized protein n=1 Tax=[Candida] jaroonii TaxID=467808 RepID=A0ACA9Y2Y1_9ASCO|nr:hypothetical protein CLIB1444_01S18690 [[Candida] jaroonii]
MNYDTDKSFKKALQSASNPQFQLNSKKKNTRRKHRNSHLGCGTCKKRRIKCDENLPSCLNCLKGKLHCAYLNLDSNARNALRMAQYNQNLRNDKFEDSNDKSSSDNSPNPNPNSKNPTNSNSSTNLSGSVGTNNVTPQLTDPQQHLMAPGTNNNNNQNVYPVVQIPYPVYSNVNGVPMVQTVPQMVTVPLPLLQSQLMNQQIMQGQVAAAAAAGNQGPPQMNNVPQVSQIPIQHQHQQPPHQGSQYGMNPVMMGNQFPVNMVPMGVNMPMVIPNVQKSPKPQTNDQLQPQIPNQASNQTSNQNSNSTTPVTLQSNTVQINNDAQIKQSLSSTTLPALNSNVVSLPVPISTPMSESNSSDPSANISANISRASVHEDDVKLPPIVNNDKIPKISKLLS